MRFLALIGEPFFCACEIQISFAKVKDVMDLREELILLKGCLLCTLFVQRLQKIRIGIEAAEIIYLRFS